MAVTKARSNPETGGLLTAAARSVGHAAGEAVKALGFQAGAATAPAPAASPKPAKGKVNTARRPSPRSRRSAKAAEVKEAAAALDKEAGFDDVRYRRIMGKAAPVWSEKDIDYIEGLVKGR
jgi:hypothetical protein